MVKIKRLANIEDTLCSIDSNVTFDELQQREVDYQSLSDKKMKTKYVESIYHPVHLSLDNSNFPIQLNCCSNPFCKNFNKPQKKYNIGKGSRYRLSGKNKRVIFCGNDPEDKNGIPTLGCLTKTFSNWSLATEIERLTRINSVVPLEPEYEFHKEGCMNPDTYFSNPKSFYKRGTASSKAQKVQCKTCKKYTNILPDKSRTTSYNQKRNEVLIPFARHLINHVPVSRTCEILGIGRGTYYQKLEWLYRCCLEFLETRETKPFSQMNFERIWLNTDMMAYYLNNIRKKGQRKLPGDSTEKQLKTQTVVTTELYSRYVFRADVAYDWDINFEKIMQDTKLYKDDHLPEELRQNMKYSKYSYYPMEPTNNDSQPVEDYYSELSEFNKRKRYVDGLHINHTYTIMAQMFLIKQMVKASKWRIVSDDDNALKIGIKKVFADEIKQDKLHYFVNNFDKTLSRDDAYLEYVGSIKDLREWGEFKGFEGLSLYDLAVKYIEQMLSTHKFYERKTAPNGKTYTVHKPNKIEHPIATADRGSHFIDVITDTSNLSDEHLARLIVQANDHSVNAFLQEIRRSISVLERPLVTSRGDGKSYIYSNFNPKYAQMSITILRTYYNFCETFLRGKSKLTPAQRIGIADRIYTWEDIIYKR